MKKKIQKRVLLWFNFEDFSWSFLYLHYFIIKKSMSLPLSNFYKVLLVYFLKRT